MLGVTMAIHKACVLFLNMPTVWQKNGAQITRRWRSVDLAAIPLRIKKWQVATVV